MSREFDEDVYRELIEAEGMSHEEAMDYFNADVIEWDFDPSGCDDVVNAFEDRD